MATYPEIGSPTGPAQTGTIADPQYNPSTQSMRPSNDGSMPPEGARQMAHDSTQKVADQARNVAGQVKEQARTQLAGQKEKASQQLGGIEDALKQTSQTLRQNDQSPVADYVERAAQQVGHLNQYLRNHTVNELVDEAERYARREPALFLGTAALLGLAAARFFRASSPGRQHTYRRDGDSYPPIHNTAGAMMPRTRPQQTTEFVATTSDTMPMEGRRNG